MEQLNTVLGRRQTMATCEDLLSAIMLVAD